MSIPKIEDPRLVTFEFTKWRDDGAGDLVVSTEDVLAKGVLANISPALEGAELAEAYGAPILRREFVTKRGATDSEGWFETEATLDLSYTQPYYDELMRRTGSAGPDNLDLTRYTENYGVCHTGFYVQWEIRERQLWQRQFLQVRDWTGKTALERSDIRALNAAKDRAGKPPYEPQYLSVGGGLFRPNPDYGKPRRAVPALVSGRLWLALADWWYTHEANAAQRELIVLDEQRQTALFNNRRHLYGNFRQLPSSGISTDSRRSDLSWQEFQAVK